MIAPLCRWILWTSLARTADGFVLSGIQHPPVGFLQGKRTSQRTHRHFSRLGENAGSCKSTFSTTTLQQQAEPSVGSMNKNEDEDAFGGVASPRIPLYDIGDVGLYKTWFKFVQDEKVVVDTTVYEENIPVRYGVRANSQDQFEEFVTSISQDSRIQQMNETLSRAATADVNTNGDDDHQNNLIFQDGPFAAQLLLIRTLRPRPSAGLGVGSPSSLPPPYNAEEDSFVTGPLRLTNRPRAAILNDLPILHSPWDVYHNISPVDPRGHFLLLPTLQDKQKNWRGQTLLSEDIIDLVHLTSTVQPLGSLLVSFNSVGAGASQNHIHCHAWPAPPIALETTTIPRKRGWECYAVSQTRSMIDFVDLFDGQVEVTYLNYPCFCIELSSSCAAGEDSNRFTLLGQAVSCVLDSIGDAPFNIGMVNRPSSNYDDDDDDVLVNDNLVHISETSDNDDDFADAKGGIAEAEEDDEENDIDVDVYIFVRSKERSSILPTSKLGASEMMGVFHVSSLQDLLELQGDGGQYDYPDFHDHSHDHDHEGDPDQVDEGRMAQALREVSYEPSIELWEAIKERLMELNS
mmetsp:Transcript_15726/g.24459  ORF Transcript_15726/g.24459 Transcript_15726/m.24459 type:complete len:574 (+) Transcript_15726:161-1882(+)